MFICRPGVRAPRPLAPDVMTAGVWGLKIALCSQHRETEEGQGGTVEARGKAGNATKGGLEVEPGEVIEKNVSEGPIGR